MEPWLKTCTGRDACSRWENSTVWCPACSRVTVMTSSCHVTSEWGASACARASAPPPTSPVTVRTRTADPLARGLTIRHSCKIRQQSDNFNKRGQSSLTTSLPHTDGSVVFARWRQCAPHLAHPHSTGAAPCWVVLSLSIAAHVRAYTGLDSFSPENFPFTCGHLYPHLTHVSLGPHESTIQTACRSVQPFCRIHNHDRQTDRPTDHATPSVINVRSTTMRPNNNSYDNNNNNSIISLIPVISLSVFMVLSSWPLPLPEFFWFI